MAQAAISGATYFGKVPSRGDFIKGSGQNQLVSMLDRWLSASMEQMASDPRWKTDYDSAAPLHFAFVGPRSRLAVVGHLRPSHDASSRRFPFLTAATIETPEGALFRHAPAYFSQLWGRFKRITEQSCAAPEAAPVLQELQQLDCPAEIASAAQGDPLGIFLRTHTLARLQSLLDAEDVNVRRIMLGLGLLLSPLLGSARVNIEKGLSLPLPADPMYRDLTAALWMSLVAGFLSRTPAELQVLIGARQGRHRMVIGFNGATPRPLLSLLSPHLMVEANIELDDPEWVDAHPDLASNYGVAKLSSYLEQPDTALAFAVRTFNEVFIGE
jgi:type VI secretion system protein ImpM